MEEKTDLRNDLYHLARIALQGRPSDIALLVRKYAKRYRSTEPQFADELIALLRKSPVTTRSTRHVEPTRLPLDNESRVPLVRIVETPVLESEPIYDSVTWEILRQLVRERQEFDRLIAAGVEPTRSVLFTGPPGVGKTLAAKWVSCELGRPLATLDLSSVMSSFLGRTGTNVRAVLDFCKEHDCVLLLDELDAVAKRRDDDTEIGELKRLVTVLLQEIDEWPSTSLLLAATNHAKLLDSAVWRRFEVLVEFPMPNATSISELLRNQLDLPRNSSWLKTLSMVLPTASFSDVVQIAKQVHRVSVLNDVNIDSALHRVLGVLIERLPRKHKRQLGVDLVQLRLFSQRRASELTGVSRDTIRKYVNTKIGDQSRNA